MYCVNEANIPKCIESTWAQSAQRFFSHGVGMHNKWETSINGIYGELKLSQFETTGLRLKRLSTLGAVYHSVLSSLCPQ